MYCVFGIEYLYVDWKLEGIVILLKGRDSSFYVFGWFC